MNTTSRRPKTKEEKLRLASKICWLAGSATTIMFFRVVFAAGIKSEPQAWILAVIVGAGVQYLMTLIEGMLIDGMLPAPWDVDWTAGGPVPFMVVGALGTFLLDVILNIGGVAVFTTKLTSQVDGGMSTLGMSTTATAVFVPIFTVFFACLLALGSELLDAAADHVAGIQAHATPMNVKQVIRQERLQEPTPEPSRKRQVAESDSAQVLAAIRARRNGGK